MRSDTVAESARLARKLLQERQGRALKGRVGFIKGYMEGELAIILEYRIAGIPENYHLIFHRVPSRHFHSKIIARTDIGASIAGCACVHTEPRDVFSFPRELGEHTNVVIAAGIPIRSRVWLDVAKRLPKYWGDGPAFEKRFKIGGVLRPQKVSGCGDRAAAVDYSSVCGLVEGVSGVSGNSGNPPAPKTGDRLRQLDLVNGLAGLLICLNDTRANVSVEKARDVGFEFAQLFLCPVDGLLGAGYGCENSTAIAHLVLRE